jgi:hypothetical protein
MNTFPKDISFYWKMILASWSVFKGVANFSISFMGILGQLASRLSFLIKGLLLAWLSNLSNLKLSSGSFKAGYFSLSMCYFRSLFSLAVLRSPKASVLLKN